MRNQSPLSLRHPSQCFRDSLDVLSYLQLAHFESSIYPIDFTATMCPPIDQPVEDLQKEPGISKDLLGCLPSDDLSHGSYQLAESILPRAILNHSVRVFLIADWLLQREHKELDPPINRSLLCVACLLHDVGCAQQFDGPQRFEIEGADAAVRFLLEQGVPKPDTFEVWQAIALHTTPGIAERISPFVCLVRQAVLFDFNQQLESTSSEIRLGFEKLFPRLEIEKILGDTVVDQALRQPEKAPPASWPGILVRAKKESPDWTGINKAF